jgi:hypothetical protein
MTISNAILFRMPFGIPGDVSRPSQATIEAQPFGATAFGAYGVPVKLVNGLIVPVGAGDTTDNVYGLLVRPFPTTGANASDPLGTGVPLDAGLANILKRGYMTVFSGGGTPAPNSQVYFRTAAGASGRPVGELEALMSDPANQQAIVGAYFMSAADASGNAELAYNL